MQIKKDTIKLWQKQNGAVFYASQCSCLSYDTISPLFNVKRNLLFIDIQDRDVLLVLKSLELLNLVQ